MTPNLIFDYAVALGVSLMVLSFSLGMVCVVAVTAYDKYIFPKKTNRTKVAKKKGSDK